MENLILRCQQPEEEGGREVFSAEHDSTVRLSSSVRNKPSRIYPVDTRRTNRARDVRSKGTIVVVVCVCFVWTIWLVLLNLAPNATVNHVMKTQFFDYGSFWLFVDPPNVLPILATIGLSLVAFGYLGVLIKVMWGPQNKVKPRRSPNKVQVMQRISNSLHEATVTRTRTSSATLQKFFSLAQENNQTTKCIKLGIKVADLILQTLLLFQMLESGSPMALVIILTLIVAFNAISCAFVLFIPYNRSPLGEILIDIIFDFLIAIGFPMLIVFYCLSSFTFDRAKLAINLEVFPTGWFEQNANAVADPVETATIYQTLQSLRITSVPTFFTRVGVNITFCFRLWQLVGLVQDTQKQRSSVYPKGNRLAAALLIIFAVLLVVFVEESVRTSMLACKPHPECVVNARRWIVIEKGSLTQCPCLMLIDRDIAPKTWAEWVNPGNVTSKVWQNFRRNFAAARI